MKTLAIIGTAGRKEDGPKLSLYHWHAMCAASRKIVELENVGALVSGGAAWSDHVAVELHMADGLPLCLYRPGVLRDEMISQYYHTQFGRKLGRDTWAEVEAVSNQIKKGGFKDRNSDVANTVETFLAMTFGTKRLVKDGGTLDTVRKMLDRGLLGYHLDLNTTKLYKL
jgi:hypothetical protein